jgi:hypothetical protein
LVTLLGADKPVVAVTHSCQDSLRRFTSRTAFARRPHSLRSLGSSPGGPTIGHGGECASTGGSQVAEATPSPCPPVRSGACGLRPPPPSVATLRQFESWRASVTIHDQLERGRRREPRPGRGQTGRGSV